VSGFKVFYTEYWNNGGVGIAQSVLRRAERPGFESRRMEDFSVPHNVQTESVVHPISYQMGIEDDIPGSEAAGA
jgi:hypothetical protein